MRGTPLLLAALLLATGCGGGDEPSAEAYVEDGNAACAAANERAGAVERPTADSAEAVETYASAVLPIARDRLAALRELDPPADDERFHERLLLEQERFVAAVETVADAAGREDRATAQRAFEEGARARARSRLLFQELGLSACAESAL